MEWAGGRGGGVALDEDCLFGDWEMKRTGGDDDDGVLIAHSFKLFSFPSIT